MSGLFGGLVLFVLLLIGVAFYQLGVRHQVHALQSRLRTAAVTLSQQIRPEAVLALDVAADRNKPEYRELVDLFRRIAREEPQFVSIYVLRPTERADMLAFAADFVAPGRASPAAVGEEYDPRQAVMAQTIGVIALLPLKILSDDLSNYPAKIVKYRREVWQEYRM